MSILTPFEEARATLGLGDAEGTAAGGAESGAESDAAVVKRAYRRALAQHPPDTDPDGFRRIRDAYELLRDPWGRAEEILVRPLPQAPRPRRRPPRPPSPAARRRWRSSGSPRCAPTRMPGRRRLARRHHGRRRERRRRERPVDPGSGAAPRRPVERGAPSGARGHRGAGRRRVVSRGRPGTAGGGRRGGRGGRRRHRGRRPRRGRRGGRPLGAGVDPGGRRPRARLRAVRRARGAPPARQAREARGCCAAGWATPIPIPSTTGAPARR